jgi:transcription-repair coupling factor (superfamily II helicase)
VRGAEDPLSRLKEHARNTAHRVLVLAESEGRKTSLLDFLHASHLSPPSFDSLAEFEQSMEPLGIATSLLNTGFSWLEQGIDFVTETELFAAGPTTRRRKKQEQVSDVEALIKDLSELNLGDPVVHSQHGIGRYRGLINLDLGNSGCPTANPICRSFCTWNTRTKPRCTCRSANCSSSAATPA